MNQQPPLEHIKTEFSENEKEHNNTKDINVTSVIHYSQSASKYICSICSRVHLTCPCPLSNQSVSSFAYKLPENKNHHNERFDLNKSVNRSLSTSVPKITFTYA
jgi:hypothetical protein